MKKKLQGVFLILIVILFAGCSKEKSIDLSKEKEIRTDNIKITPVKAYIEDEQLNLVLKWQHGNDEDSMDKQKFNNTGVIFFAKQNNMNLEWDIKNSQNINDDVYEATEREVTLKFDLDNKTDTVQISASKNGEPIRDSNFSIDIKTLE